MPVEWLSKGLDGLLRLWDRGAALLWALAAVCAAAFAVLLGGTLLGIAGAATALEPYGLALLLAIVGLGVLAAVKTIQSRYRPPTVHLIANNAQSLWAQSKQQDGRITTQLSFRMQVTNLTDDFIRLSEVRVSRPWTRARILANVLTTRHPNYPTVNFFSHEYPLEPRAISEASCTLIFEGAIGRPGRPMTAVFKVSDQFGRWHRVKFRLIDPRPR